MQCTAIKIAIHHRKGSFSDKWIEYCKEHNLEYALINCFDNSIVSNLQEFDALLWNFELGLSKESLFAKNILISLEQSGLKVFPNFNTCWHYDDKISQKYLLESICNYTIPTYIFYDLESANEWITNTSFPKVFKLSKGAGSSNVMLVKTQMQAMKLAKKAFGSGFSHFGLFKDTSNRLQKLKQKKDYLRMLKRLPSTLRNIHAYKLATGKEKNYLYFQDFIPNNSFDTRVTVIGERAFAFRRFVRDNDFRASGSGRVDYSPDDISLDCVQIAFQISKRLKTQSIACDFVRNSDKDQKLIEVSYSFDPSCVYNCPGYWSSHDLKWNSCHIWPQDAIIHDLINTIHISNQ